jgi:hypothetical protein
MAKSKAIDTSANWHNPAVREENAHTDFRRSPVIFMATVEGTVLEADASEGFLRTKYAKNSRVSIWALNQNTGFRYMIKSGSVHY